MSDLTTEIVLGPAGWGACCLDADGRVAQVDDRWYEDVLTGLRLLEILGTPRQLIIFHPAGYPN